MKRNEFIRSCGMACAGLAASGFLMNGCATTSVIQAVVSDGKLKLATSDFQDNDKMKRYILVNAKQLDYPLVVYRNNEEDFRAMLLKCTHQGTELDVYGDLISCAAHGSEFDREGRVISGPAKSPLKSFPLEKINGQLLITIS